MPPTTPHRTPTPLTTPRFRARKRPGDAITQYRILTPLLAPYPFQHGPYRFRTGDTIPPEVLADLPEPAYLHLMRSVAPGVGFGSPEINMDPAFTSALHRYLGQEHKQYLTDIISHLTSHGYHATAEGTLGDWGLASDPSSYGSETSAIFTFPSHSGDSYLDAAMSRVGQFTNPDQLATIRFRVEDHPAAPDTLWTAATDLSLHDTRTALDNLGLFHRTLQTSPITGKTHVHLFDPGSTLEPDNPNPEEEGRKQYRVQTMVHLADNPSIHLLSEHLHAPIGKIRGYGRFIGADTRDEAHGVYQHEIDAWERSRPEGPTS